MRREEDSEEVDEERGNHGEQDSGSFGLFIHQNENGQNFTTSQLF